jgi:hypothetical protein
MGCAFFGGTSAFVLNLGGGDVAVAQQSWTLRGGLAILHSALSGHSGQKVWPQQAGQEGVCDGQEIRAADAPHAHGGVQGPRSIGGDARGPGILAEGPLRNNLKGPGLGVLQL